MIFADKIINLRKKNGWSQEVLAEKLEVSRQTISKWESAQSVPDFKRMIQISELFGVSTDYLLKDSIEQEEFIEKEIQEDKSIYNVSLEMANSFINDIRREASKVAIGVSLCILSPIILIILSGLSEKGLIGISEKQAKGIGLLVALLMIAYAVAIFVIEHINMSKYEILKKKSLETEYGVSGMAKGLKEKYKNEHANKLTVGITLCVISSIPIFIAMILENNILLEVFSVPLLLVFVALGVMFIVNTSIIWSGFDILLEEGDYKRDVKQEEEKNATIASVYWCIVLTIYLAYSFTTNNWDESWMVWPVSGVFYGAFTAVLKIIRSR